MRFLSKSPPYRTQLARLGFTLQLSYTLHQVLREFNQPPSVSDYGQHDRLILAAAMIVQSDGVKFFVGHHITSPFWTIRLGLGGSLYDTAHAGYSAAFDWRKHENDCIAVS